MKWRNRFYCLVVVLFVVTGCQPKNQDMPSAKDGVLDLTNWNFEKEGLVKLNGEWEFYWRQFYSHEDFLLGDEGQKTGNIVVPGIWRYQDFGTTEVDWYGYATMRLKILLPQGQKKLLMEIENIRTAYELEVNGEIVASCGQIGTSVEASKPEFSLKRPLIFTDSSELNLVIRLSEFHRDSGGVLRPISIATNDVIYSRSQKVTTINWLLIGILLFASIYHFALYYLRTKEIVNLFFAVFCVNFILRLLTRGDMFFYELVGMNNWWLINKVEFTSLYLIPILYLFYFNKLFSMPKLYFRWIVVFLSIMVLIVLFSPSFIYIHTLLIFQLSGVLLLTYGLYVAFMGYLNKMDFSMVFLLGFVILLLGGINDVLNLKFIITTMEVFDYSCIIFIFVQAYGLAIRSVRAINQEEELSKYLDKKVVERTEQLSKANVVKGKLLSIVSHDLRGPLTSLHGVLGLIQNEQLDRNEEKVLLKGVAKSLKSSMTLLDNILLWASSQLKSNSVIVKIEPLNMKLMADESIEPFLEDAERKGITITNELNTNCIALADKNMIKSVFRNLINNAIKFTLEYGTVKISCQKDNGNVVIMIADSGIGLSEELKENIFRSDEVKVRLGTSNEKGAGVGLILCEDLVTQMNGKIWAKPASEGPGSVFGFTLPLS